MHDYDAPDQPHAWTLTDAERATLAAALDALMPPADSFPAPSQTRVIDDFFLARVPPESDGWLPYPFIHAGGLRALLAELDGVAASEMPAALARLEAEQPRPFTAFWRLAVFGYYSRPETIAAIQRDLAPNYHGAPLPLGYGHVIPPWDAADPFQNPRHTRGSWTPTGAVRRVSLPELDK